MPAKFEEEAPDSPFMQFNELMSEWQNWSRIQEAKEFLETGTVKPSTGDMLTELNRLMPAELDRLLFLLNHPDFRIANKGLEHGYSIKEVSAFYKCVNVYALDQAHRGKWSEAFRAHRIEQLFYNQEEAALLITTLLHVVHEGLATKKVETIFQRTDPPKEIAKEWITELKPKVDRIQPIREAIRIEYRLMRDYAEKYFQAPYLARGNLYHNLPAWKTLIAPFLGSTKDRSLRNLDAAFAHHINAIDRDRGPLFKANAPDWHDYINDPIAKRHLSNLDMQTTAQRVRVSHFRIQALRIAIAARAFRSEQGHWPASPEALVPEYFSKLPVDLLGLDSLMVWESPKSPDSDLRISTKDSYVDDIELPAIPTPLLIPKATPMTLEDSLKKYNEQIIREGLPPLPIPLSSEKANELESTDRK